jgi:hypothetical protein
LILRNVVVFSRNVFWKVSFYLLGQHPIILFFQNFNMVRLPVTSRMEHSPSWKNVSVGGVIVIWRKEWVGRKNLFLQMKGLELIDNRKDKVLVKRLTAIFVKSMYSAQWLEMKRKRWEIILIIQGMSNDKPANLARLTRPSSTACMCGKIDICVLFIFTAKIGRKLQLRNIKYCWRK